MMQKFGKYVKALMFLLLLSCGATPKNNTIVYIDGTSFSSQKNFDATWNLYYPWGTDHNGSARMYTKNVAVKPGGILNIRSNWLHNLDEGKSSSDPHLKINFHSGAVHAKQQIKVTKELPFWEISGEVMLPTIKSTWPAFWLTGVDSWPPEIDLVEFKGAPINWMNTVTGEHWKKTKWTTEKTRVDNASTVWHTYKLTLQRIDETNTIVSMFLDGILKTN